MTVDQLIFSFLIKLFYFIRVELNLVISLMHNKMHNKLFFLICLFLMVIVAVVKGKGNNAF